MILRCPAEPRTLQTIRSAVDGWLTELDWPEEEREDVVLAVNEACANAVDHAYPRDAVGEVVVVGRLQVDGPQRRVVMLVRDQGRWRPAPTDPGHRGHGLTVMEGCMQQLDVRRGSDGTTVLMTSSPVPNLAPARPVRRRPVLGRPGTASTVRVPVAERESGERRHRRARILSRAGELEADGVHLSAAAETACAHTRRLLQTSRRLVADARTIRTSRR